LIAHRESTSTEPRKVAWLTIRAEPPAGRSAVLKICSFIIPLLLWCMVSYVPFIWHPLVRVTDKGESDFLQPDMLIKRAEFESENDRLREEKLIIAQGEPANPIFLPAPHEVGRALYTAFKTPPQRKGDPWFHESLWHSIQIIFWGFSLSCILGVPLGILCGTFQSVARLTEPFVDFVRYMPAPVFGALCIAVLGLEDAPKIAIIFIGTFFHMVLVISNTTRLIDPATGR
jgi:NitT/TauT family transport system permease protein